ncbi:MAG TPA: hypothetical protein VGW96_01895 [Candidatus Eremiobacteraceae bacterium]|nr:hypothetical protein [Candidatus Eremiobacteraceae bacterium]
MELLDRYVQAVKDLLPRPKRDDIALEISDTLRSEMEDKETELGRPLNRDEEASILKAYGHPRLVASRYGRLQYLIGPTLLPFYFYTLRIVLIIVVVIQVVLGLTIGATSNDVVGTLLGFWGPLWGSIFFVIGIITVIFALLEYFGGRLARVDAWNPASLPPVQNSTWVPRFNTAVDLVFNVVFVLWVVGVVPVRELVGYMLLGPGMSYFTSSPFSFAAWWHILVPALVVVALVNIATDVINLAQPQWARFRTGVAIGTNSILFVVMCFLLTVHPYVIVAKGVAHPERYQSSADALSGTVFAILVAWAIIPAFLVVTNVLKLRKSAQVVAVK